MTIHREGDSMELIEWSEASQLDLAAIDAEHRQLAELINRLYVAMRVRQPLGTLRPYLAELEAYADAHFDGEERLMHEHRHPGPEIKVHAAEHAAFRDCLRSLAHELDAGNATFRLDLWQFVAAWWNRHILGSDVRMAHAFHADAP